MTTVDAAEIAKFERISQEWWEPEGQFKPLHQINPVRVDYICSKLTGPDSVWEERISPVSESGQQRPTPSYGDLTGLEIVDIGCGGGILAEALDQLGASVIGIDRSEHIIGAAKAHQQESGSSVDYRVQSAAALATQRPNSFDVVLAMEVLEHVPDVSHFLLECASLLKPEGIFFFATLNRTIKSWAMAIVGAEYVLRWLPRGTHTYGKFIRPAELDQDLRRVGIRTHDIRGLSYVPWRDEWQLSQNPDVNYLGFGQRE